MQSNLSLYKETNFNWVHSTLLNDRIDAKNYKVEYLELQRKIISQTYIRLRDVIEDIKNGFEVNRSYSDVGLKFLTVKDLKEFEINYSDIKKIDLHFRDTPEKGRLKEGDIIITRSGSIGIAKTITNNDEDIVISSDIIKLRVNNKIDRDYLTTYLNSDTGRKLIEQLSYGAVIKKIGQEELLDLLIPIPSPEIQKYIGDKVRKAEELREEAKRLKKDAEEIINESLNIKQLDVLFEGSKVKFEWASAEILTDRIDANYYEQKYVETINHIKKFSKKYITLNSIIDSIYTGKKPIYYEKGIEAYFVQSGNISSNFLELDNKEKVDLSKYNQILFGDLLIAKDGETIGKIAINLTNETVIINEHTYCVRLKEEYKYYSAYIYYFLTNKYINPLIRREATGSAQKGLNFTFTENIIIPILEEDKIMNLYNLELRRCNNIYKSKQLIQEAKRDVEDLIEGNFDMSKVKANS